jgi:hypothetical protein
MKTKVSYLFKAMTAVMVLFVFSAFVFADGEKTEVFLTGSTNTPAGDYVVQTTSDIFNFQGKEYEVFKVYYDDPEMNMRIAVNNQGKCTSFIAFTNEYYFFYNCNKHGFGVRKVMFSNPYTHNEFNPSEFHSQTVLLHQRKIEKKQAVGLIATYLPKMKS